MRCPKLSIRGSMAGVAACALLFSVLRTFGSEMVALFLLLTVGAAAGAFFNKRTGGPSIVGGSIGGAITYVGLGVLQSLWFYQRGAYLADPTEAFVFATISGATVGFVVGTFFWGVTRLHQVLTRTKRAA